SPPTPFQQSWRGELSNPHDLSSTVSHHSEGTFSMKLPLIILSVCTVAAGFVPFSKFITSDGVALETHTNIVFSLAPVALAIIAILIAARLYKKQNDKPEKIAAFFGSFYKAAYKKFNIDQV